MTLVDISLFQNIRYFHNHVYYPPHFQIQGRKYAAEIQNFTCFRPVEILQQNNQQSKTLYITLLFTKRLGSTDLYILLFYRFLLLRLLIQNMLHELLMSLLGNTGAIIKPTQLSFAIDPHLAIVPHSEANLINQIASTGYYYGQITTFIDFQICESTFADYKKEPSVYRKAMAKALKMAMEPFEDLILQIQNGFMKNRQFTFSNIGAEVNRYGVVMKEMWQIIQRISLQKYRGGVIIDILWQVFQKSSEWLKQWLHLLLTQCHQVFIRQVTAWITHGEIIDTQSQFFIHKVIQEPEQKFKFHKTLKKNMELTRWDIYTIDNQLIPLSLITAETAAKILFIGKSVKILKGSGKMSGLVGSNRLNGMNVMLWRQHCPYVLESAIQKIRQGMAQEMIELIIGQQNLISQLEKINSYYLMTNGQFYHHFLEEAKCIQSITQREKVQKKINQTCLQNAFLRINRLEDSKRLYFEIKPLGFSYVGFKNFLNVCPVGNIDLVEGKFVRFSASGGAIWHRTKQVVQNNFSIMLAVCFKKSKLMVKKRKGQLQERACNMVSVVLQNSKDISASFHENPESLSKISEYIAINIGYKYSQQTKNYLSIISVTYKNQKKYQKEVVLSTYSPKTVNFLDQTLYMLKISYANDEFKTSIVPLAQHFEPNENNTFKIDSIRISNYLNLQMSRCNIGMVSNIRDYDCQAEIQQWEMICKPTNHYGDHWSDLSINLKINWPLNLILTPDIMETFSRINRFLFPIRQVQIDLQQLWVKIPRRLKENCDYIGALQRKNIEQFYKRVCTTRWRMNLTINSLWCYLQGDVITTAWNKLKSSISKSDDFEEIIQMISKYLNTIQTMFYFNALKIQRTIHELIRQARIFVAFFHKINSHSIDDKIIKEYQNIDDMFRKNLDEFYRLLRDLSKTTNSSHLFHLTQRIQCSIDQSSKGYF